MKFRNEYWFLSNMYNCPIVINGITYSCVESAFQSFKTEDKELRKKFAKLNGFEAKKLGRKIPLRKDWNEIRLEVMYLIVKKKFKDEKLMNMLKNIKGEIVEDNTWNDTFWGRCNGKGENNLGKILMAVRDDKDYKEEPKKKDISKSCPF